MYQEQELQLLKSSLAQHKGKDRKKEAQLSLVIAQYHLKHDEHKEANKYLDKVIEARNEKYMEDTELIACIKKCELLNLAGRFDDSRKLLLELLPCTKKANLYYQTAEIYYLAGVINNRTLQYEKTVMSIRKAFEQLEVYDELVTESLRAVCYFTLAEAHECLGDQKLSKDAYKSCVEVSREVGDLENLAKSLIKLGDMTRSPLEAERYFKEAMEVGEKIDDNGLTAVNAKMYYGKKFISFEEDKAEILLTEALEVIDGNEKLKDSLTHIYYFLTELYAHKADYHKLCFFGKELRQIATDKNMPTAYAYVQLMFAEYLIKQNDKENAIKYAKDALEKYEQFGTRFDQDDIDRAKNVINKCE